MRDYINVAVCLSAALFCVTSIQADDWKPAPNTLMTQWAEKVDPAHPLPEYPRPQLVRKEWTNLNGLWDYAITAKDAAKPEKWDGKILVPFCIESALSGLKKPLDKDQRLWYRRTFGSPELKDGGRLLIHFGAVDWEAVVWLNGKELGSHKGGYDGFTFDATDSLKKGGDNELIVGVWDPTGVNGAPVGKQRFDVIAKPHGIFYTPCSGIWQTVWMEPVAAMHLSDLKISPDIANKTVTVTANVGGGNGAMGVVIDVVDGDKTLYTAKAQGQGGGGAGVTHGMTIVLPVANAELWTPESPKLYGLRISVLDNGKQSDFVESYFAMRKSSVGKDDKGVVRLMLNDQPVFQAGPLDQGFWPDGIYTAPTDVALKYDIEITKKLGFNATRKHVKVEPERWYYWCDKLGLLVWQDMPGGGVAKNVKRESGKDGTPESPEKATQFEAELKALIEQRGNHPCIVQWVVFNEGWGQYDTPRVTKLVQDLDPTRVVNNASGWEDQKVGDVHDMHHYPAPAMYKPEESRASVLGEFGGLGLPIPGHKWVESEKNWGYQNMAGDAALTDKYVELWKSVWTLRDEGLSAAIYTQLTDVETESNGLLSYDRKVIKMNVEKSAAAAQGK